MPWGDLEGTEEESGEGSHAASWLVPLYSPPLEHEILKCDVMDFWTPGGTKRTRQTPLVPCAHSDSLAPSLRLYPSFHLVR